jgi:hypothetical protein
MRRVHLLEIHEQSWCPRVIRDATTAFLGFVATVGRQYDRVAPMLRVAVDAVRAERIVDLCSGGGGPWPRLERVINRDRQPPLTILLTDRFPHCDVRRFANERIRYVDRPVDATQTPPELVGFRTLFTSFHHFKPAAARAILRDAARRGQGIAIFEQTARTLPAALFMLALPVLVFVSAPFVRPFRWTHFFWTCLVPVVPLVLSFDGIVSCLRTYTRDELREMTASLGDFGSGTSRSRSSEQVASETAAYVWDIGWLRAPLSGLGITYVIGYPRPDTSAG